MIRITINLPEEEVDKLLQAFRDGVFDELGVIDCQVEEGDDSSDPTSTAASATTADGAEPSDQSVALATAETSTDEEDQIPVPFPGGLTKIQKGEPTSSCHIPSSSVHNCEDNDDPV